MNPSCAKCKLPVYPTEKLNCLDKIWHRTCFKCETCHMVLNMKTYKGYNKLPYCNAHYPTTKPVSDIPENLRLPKNTTEKSQQVEYHKTFSSEKGRFTSEEEDPETVRMKKTKMQASDNAFTNRAWERAPEPRLDNRPRQAPPAAAPRPRLAPRAPHGAGEAFLAIYDYQAADEDEVSFQEGDIIIDATVIDDGWMQGRVERTGMFGMLPSSYVEAK